MQSAFIHNSILSFLAAPTKTYVTFDLTIPLLGICPTETLTHVHKDTVRDVLSIRSDRKQMEISETSIQSRELNKLRCIHTVENSASV